LDAVLLVASDGAVTAAWHGDERGSGRFTGWLAAWRSARV
jgi:carbamoyltransferase